MKPNFNFKFYKEFRLISLIIILYIITNKLVLLLSNLLESHELEYNRFYPAAILLALIFGIINTYLHKIPSLWKCLMKTPLVRGVYEGSIKYMIDEVEKEKKCEMKIYQTASKIKIDTTFWNEDKHGNIIDASRTISESSIEDFIENARDNYELHFYYSNGGSYNSEIPTKMGYNILKFDPEQKKFDGIYFSRNSMARGNGGNVNVKFKRKLE